MRGLILTVIALAVWPLAAAAQQPAAGGYEELLARARRGDATLDFQALRFAFTETPQYQPYGGPAMPFKDAMWKAIKAGDFAVAAAQAEKVIEIAFVDIDAHMMADQCYRRLGDTANADAHRTIARGLLRSIQQSGDGKKPATAYVVIAVSEEYSLLYALGYQRNQQSLIQDNGHAYDRLDVKDPKTGEAVQIFFNVDRPMGEIARELKDKK